MNKKLTTNWDMSSLGNAVDDKRFIKERKKVEATYKAFSKKWSKSELFLTNEEKLKEALDDYEKIAAYESRESRYLFLTSMLDSQDTNIQAASTLYRDYSNTLSDYIRFFELKLGTIKPIDQKKFLNSELLSEYRNFLKNIFNSSRYFLSEPEEKILSMKSSVSSDNWVDMLDEFISSESADVWVKDQKTSKLVKREQSFSDLMNNLRSTNKKISDSSIEALKNILEKYHKVAEKEINSFLENKKINDELRCFARPDSSRHNAEDIETKAVDTLLKTVTDNFKVSKDYYRFKAQLMGLKSFSYWERIVAYGKLKTQYAYPEAVKIVARGLARISPEFKDLFLSFTTNGQIDVYPKKGKTGGAFCMPSYDGKVNLLLNHSDSFRNVSTLAHEMGHGIHAMKARAENALNYDVPMCTAEVASTFCEDFVVDEVLNMADDQERLIILVGQLEDKVATVFRQVAAYNFELELHNEFRTKGYLPEQEIGKMFNKHMKSYMGSAVDFDNDSGRGWMYWSHFRSPFYVYSYAMALLVAQSAKKRLEKNPSYIEKINEFYSTGSSLPPKEIYKNLGMNINSSKVWQEGIDEINEILKEAKKLAKKLGKI